MDDIAHVAVIEHQTLARFGMERVLSHSPALRVVATVAEVGDLPCENDELDAIVLGPCPQSEDLAETVRRLSRRANVVVVSDFTGPQRLIPTVRAGALGCLTKQVGDREFRQAVQTVAEGGFHVSPVLAPRLLGELNDLGASDPRVLAPRELETVRHLADGLTHGQIARRMGLTEATVSTHVKRIRSKLNVGNKADLTRTAIELGLLRSEPAPPARTEAAALAGSR
ncbi:response regulator transcription factor [Kitasatospora cinereorecta]|uniref:DNA-binding response regulator n=1 Tax=Kitasatospora cinereorecta TaxID=285560 RepID=A0ABW0VC72_9ACTN